MFIPRFQPALQGFHRSLAEADVTLKESLRLLKGWRGFVRRVAISNLTNFIIGGYVPERPTND
jgi:hypothetical protein